MARQQKESSVNSNRVNAEDTPNPNADDDVWVSSKWSSQQLDGQSVEFRIPLQGQQHLHGIGRFLAKHNANGRLSVKLCTFEQKTAADTSEVRIPLEQAAVDRIERHPDQSVALFRLE
ncbi:MAG: hypothetical protein ABSH34_18620 [Verrucomicrobiota bacterium]